MRTINFLKLVIISGLLMIIVGCANSTSDFSPDQVINNALEQSENDAHSYIGAAKITTYENEEIVEDIHMKEWVSRDGRIRIETEEINGEETAVAVNDGSEVLQYLPSENEVLFFNDPELFTLNTPSAKEQTLQLLEMISETHEVEVMGEEKVAERKTFRIKATPKDSNLLGDQEVWIDKQNWMTLKMISQMGATRVETVYDEIDFNPNITDETFELDLPDDVEHVDVGNLRETENVTVKEAREKIAKPFYYLPAENDFEIDVIELDTINIDDSERMEVNFDYLQKGLPAFSITVLEQTGELLEPDEIHVDEEVIEVRGQEGIYMDMNGFRSLAWDEAGLRYSVILTDPEISLEQFLELAEDMELLE